MTSPHLSLLQKVQKIPVPEPGTGEIVILPSVEALCVWMQTNHLQVKEWHGNLLVVKQAVEAENV